MPTIKQLQNWIKYRRAKVGDNNSLEDVEKFIRQNEFEEGHDVYEDEFFCFGAKLGDGSDDNHFQVSLTSKTLLSRIFRGKVFHIDATYKIVKYFYPIIVFGVSDINRKFYPIIFAITSHETNYDYAHFFDSLNSMLFEIYDTNFNPEYIVVDASKAMYNAIKKYHPKCTVLMCWFHVRYNVRKHKSKIPEQKYINVQKQIKCLHKTTCEGNIVHR